MMSPGLAIMEDGKDPACSGNLRSGDGGLEARFEDLCKSGLSLDEETSKQALRLLQQSKNLLFARISSIGGGSAVEVERFWFACVLFSVKRLSVTNASKQEHKERKSGELSFCNILRATKLNVVEFCKEMPQFFMRAGHVLSNMYGADWEKRLEVKELQEDLVQLIILSNFYKGAYQKFFLRSDRSNGNPALAGSTEHVPDFHRFGWLLFLLLRIHVFSRFKDLVTCATGLVSVLGILILHVPVHFRNFSFNDVSLFAKKSEKGVDLISSLCEIYQTSEDDLKKTMENAKRLIMDIFKKMPCLASEHKAEILDDINTEGLFYFEDLMNSESISSSLLILEENYNDAFSSKGDIDERMFIYEDESLLGTASFSGGSMNLSGIKRKFESLSSPVKSAVCPMSPIRSPAASPATGKFGGIDSKIASNPVSTAMTTVKWLRTVISPLPSKPSQALEFYFSSCDRDVTHEVVHRAHIILTAIFPSNHGEQAAPGSLQITNLMDSIWADERKMEALRLYYRVLEAICRAESNLLQGNNLTSLLSNERFHRCMLACSAELILATYKTTAILFPAVLEKTGITAFDLSKVIESFVRHEGSLPRELKRHLNSLEERLLESMAWEKGSSLYNSLIIARPNLATEISRQGLLAEPMPSLDAIAVQHNISPRLPLPVPRDQNGGTRSPQRKYGEQRTVMAECNFTSTVKDRLLSFSSPKAKLLPPLQSVFASPTRPSPVGGGETCAETGIQVFFEKILKLAAIRIKSLCERLQLSQQMMESIYGFIKLLLNQQSAIFFNRHIDQLILCGIYGVAKISDLKLTFKEIICNYRKQPHCRPQVFFSVYVNWQAANRNGRSARDHVDIITFYNEIFIPLVKPLLVEIGPNAAALRVNGALEDNNNDDGHCRESSKLSPFPNVPDMSPKKVSAAHNVYVSPLRPSKMDVLISPSSRSYYACVGESTHAYQSPSKDLSAINNRLNSCRKVKLNFDVGLISDSAVASCLYPQNGSSATPGTLTSVKSEQADP